MGRPAGETPSAGQPCECAEQLLTLSQELPCCTVGLLDLVPAGILQRVAQQVSSQDHQALRSTCRLLRRSQSMLGWVTKAQGGSREAVNLARDVQLLLHCPRLKKVEVCKVSSIFGLHLRWRIQGLKIHTGLPVCLMPLAGLSQLSALTLECASAQNLEHLVQLTKLKRLACQEPVSGLEKLTCLQRLTLCIAFDAASLAALVRLTRVELLEHSMHSPSAIEQAHAHLCQLPALRVLDAAYAMPQLRITQLTALHLELWEENCMEPFDASALRFLQRLLLHTSTFERPIIAPSVTALQLEQAILQESLALPQMQACHGLQHLTLRMYLFNRLLIDSAQLPPQHVAITAAQGRHGTIFVEFEALNQRFHLPRSAKLPNFVKAATS